MSPITDDLGPLYEQAFGVPVEPYRRELHVHCYRLPGSFEEAEGLVRTAEDSVNSALQGARAGLRKVPPEDREAWRHAAEPAAIEQELLARYVECSERADAEGLAALLHEDVRFSMPTPGVWTGQGTVVQGWIDGGFGSGVFGSMRCVLTLANGQPAVAGYVRKPGDAAYVPPAIDVLRVQDGVVTEIVTFDGAVFGHFDLPAALSAAGGAR